MQIELAHDSSFTSLDAIFTHGNEKVILPMGFRPTQIAELDHPGQLVTELNTHWQRRSEHSQDKLFRLYRCVYRCLENFRDRQEESEETYYNLLHEVSPYFAHILNEHNVEQLVNFIENHYTDSVPEVLPDISTDPCIYTYEEYKYLQAMVLALRSVWPIVAMLRNCLRGVTGDDRDIRIWTAMMDYKVNIYVEEPLERLRTFIRGYIERNHEDPKMLNLVEEIAGKVLFGRLPHVPLMSALPSSDDLITRVYKHMTQVVRHPPNPSRKNIAFQVLRRQ
jgi:uncharacterized protein YbgA (DUF1722 family)